MNIFIVTVDEFRMLYPEQIEKASLIIIDMGERAHVYKNRYDVMQTKDATWEEAARMVINHLSHAHVIYLPDLQPQKTSNL